MTLAFSTLPASPTWLNIGFFLLVVLSIIWFGTAVKQKKILYVLYGWTILQIILAASGFFTDTTGMPPRMMAAVLPMNFAILIALFTRSGRTWYKSLNIQTLTYFHTIRIPVELTLFLLYGYGAISLLQTFEGWNFDILSGLSAPIVGYLAFKGAQKRNLLLVWNIICLALVLIIVVISILAFPYPIQQLAFDQPNIGMFYLPFNLLASVLVPLVIISHISSILQLTSKSSDTES